MDQNNLNYCVNSHQKSVDMENTDTMQEHELVKNLESGAISIMRITEDEQGKYQIFVKLTWKQEEVQLVTQRGKPKQWASLDRLAAHIKKHYYGNIIPVTTLQIKGDLGG